MHSALKIMESSTHDLQTFSDADVAFHSAIVDYSGNSLIKAIHSSLRPTMRRFMDLTCTERADFERNRKEHRRIYAAICSGNAAEASQAIRDHLHFARRNYGLLVLSPESFPGENCRPIPGPPGSREIEAVIFDHRSGCS